MGILVNYEKPLPPVERKINHINKLLALEEKFVEEGEPDNVEDFTNHYHCEGAYVREYVLPKGHFVTGKIHKKACINIVLQGKVKVVQSDGESIVEAPYIYISEPGEKKALYALEDTRFLNVHATEETDQELLEQEFTIPAPEYIAQLTKEEHKWLGQQ